MGQVNSFLGCATLETFAKCIAKIEIVIAITVAAFCVFGEIPLLVFTRGYERIIWLLIILLLCALKIHICRELIEGVKTHDPRKIQKYRILCCIGIIIVALIFFHYFILKFFNSKGGRGKDHAAISILVTFLALIWQIYVFLCIHSLFKKVENESFPGYIIVQPNSAAVTFRPEPETNNYTAPPAYQVQGPSISRT